MYLADMGAEVVKIEPPEGDGTRFLAPFSETIPEGRLFTPFNRNKRCLALNIFSGEGKVVFLDLVKKADVVVHNFRPKVVAAEGLDYPSLKKVNSKLVYCAIAGYSPRGPNQDRPGLDFALQAESGLMSITGEPDGDPLKIPFPVIDLQASAYAAMAIAAALAARERDGQGRLVETTLFAAGVSLLAERAWAYLFSGEVPKRTGNWGIIGGLLSAYFQTSDGGLIITLPTQKMWQQFCEVREFSHLGKDPRFEDIRKRNSNRDQLVAELKKVFRQKTTQEWVQKLAREKGLVCSPVRSLVEVFADAEVEALGLVREVEHPVYGRRKVLGIPFEFPETPLEVSHLAPPIGWHTDEILRSYLKMDQVEINRLRKKKVIS